MIDKERPPNVAAESTTSSAPRLVTRRSQSGWSAAYEAREGLAERDEGALRPFVPRMLAGLVLNLGFDLLGRSQVARRHPLPNLDR
jgi:hypothetical protein